MASDKKCTELEDVRDKLRSWREDSVRQSEEVIDYWETVLHRDIRNLKDEMWNVYEQVCLAAFDCHRLDIAKVCLKALKEQFPDSLRVKILMAMKYEVDENYEEALKYYDSILVKDKTHLGAQKRKIAIFKAQGKITEAIKELTDYLKKFMSDQEAWLELCELYIQEQEYNKAAFCMEEVILFNPHNHLYYQRYAEIRYTQGGYENMVLASAYFSKAIKINPNNMRALYGLFLASNNIISSSASFKPTAQKKKDNPHKDIAAWAAKQITERFQNAQSGGQDIHLKVIENMFSTLQLAPSH